MVFDEANFVGPEPVSHGSTIQMVAKLHQLKKKIVGQIALSTVLVRLAVKSKVKSDQAFYSFKRNLNLR